jgi:putative two-component system response regulator
MSDTTDKQLICIVDDEPTNVELLRFMLEDEYDVCVAYSGEEALATIISLKPSLILLDIVMPDMSGYEVCKILRNNPGTSGIPVIFVTGLEDKASESAGLELGAVDYVVKPVVGDIVKARIERTLQTDLYIEYLERTLAEREEKLVSTAVT